MNDREGPAREERDDVARLLRLAGKRPVVAAERVERVRATAHERWRAQVRARSAANRKVWAVGGLAAAAALILAITFAVRPGTTHLSPGLPGTILVEVLSGSASTYTSDGPGSSRPLAVGDSVAVGARIATAEDGGASLRLAAGHSVRLRAGTTVRVLSADSLALDRGTLYVDSGGALAAAHPIVVETAFGRIREIGTQYEVYVERDSVRLRLREGAAILRRGGRSLEVLAGAELQMDRNGSITRRAISTNGSEWSWLVGLTPMVDLEERTARSFLDWVARERGWQLAFSDENVARSAGEIVLGGSIERLTLDQALDAVLPTCRMTHRVRDGVLVISAAADTP